MKNRAFTLIELLIVVLIIGILVAIAVPQYQKAIDKVRFTQLQLLNQKIAQAFYLYYIATGEDPENISQLDIDLPAGYTTTSFTHGADFHHSCAVYDNFYCCIAKNGKASYYLDSTACVQTDYSFGIETTGVRSHSPSTSSCIVPYNNARGMRLCNNLSAEAPEEAINFVSPTRYIYAPTTIFKLE